MKTKLTFPIAIAFVATITVFLANGDWASADSASVPCASDAYDAEGWPGYDDTADTILVGNAGGNIVSGCMFPVSIPQGSTIASATVDFTQSGWGFVIDTYIGVEQNGACNAFTAADSPADRDTFNLPLGPQEMIWTWPKETPGSVILSPQLAQFIQPIVDDADVTAICVLERTHESTPAGENHNWTSIEGGSPAILNISWNPPQGGTGGTGGPTATSPPLPTPTNTPLPTSTSIGPTPTPTLAPTSPPPATPTSTPANATPTAPPSECGPDMGDIYVRLDCFLDDFSNPYRGYCHLLNTGYFLEWMDFAMHDEIRFDAQNKGMCPTSF